MCDCEFSERVGVLRELTHLLPVRVLTLILFYDDLLDLFDADRKKGFLERFFAGPLMKRIFQTDLLVKKKTVERLDDPSLVRHVSSARISLSGALAALTMTYVL